MGVEEVSLDNENAERKSGESELGGREETEAVVMDTPVRTKNNQITTPSSKVEESPVSNFLNSLSPIEPVKSLHITQTFNPHSFSTLPSVFTSPHVSLLKESRFLRRYQLLDQSKPEFSSNNDQKVNNIQGNNLDVTNNMNAQLESYPGSSTVEASISTYCEFLQLDNDIVHSLDYECRNPNSNTVANCGIKNKSVSGFAGSSDTTGTMVHDVSGKGSLRSHVNIEGLSQIEQSKEAAGCNWEGLISGTGDVLFFDSPASIKKGVDPSPRFRTHSFFSNETQNIQTFSAAGSVVQEEIIETENQLTHPGDGSELNQNVEVQEINPDSSLSNKSLVGCPNEKREDETVSGLKRGTRRRCLAFEMAGTQKKHLHLNAGSGSNSSVWFQSDGNTTTDMHLAGTMSSCESSRCVLPGTGLHLNALAAAVKDGDAVQHVALTSGQNVLAAPGSAANLCSSTLTSSARVVHLEDGERLEEDATQALRNSANEELNQSCPSQKKRKVESGESEGCKRCNCKKSKCLKLYCDCFAAGVYCVDPCSCQECFNRPIYEDTVLATRKQIESRNPLAFTPKVIRTTDTLAEIGIDARKTPASARHKIGCNCKKSGCLKKYCECYQGGVGCSISCRCEDCKNAFGRKDGTYTDLDENQTDMIEKSFVNMSSQKAISSTEMQQPRDSVIPATPLRATKRPTMKLPFSLKKKLSLSSSSGGTYASQGLERPRFSRPLPKFGDKQFESIQEEDVSITLKENTSPTSGIKKAASPNSKRVSAHHTEIGTSPGRRSTRKLVLQSIPSFPSLTPNI